jgi:hypothetical protein
MAFQKQIIKISSKECWVKVWGTDGDSGTVLLSELKTADEDIVGTPRANIAGYQYTGDNTTTFYITRNGTQIATFSSSTISVIEMTGATCPPDPVQNDQNVTITILGGNGELFLRLRKQEGYVSKIETSTYGAYDNKTAVGS